jgi:hypothetical protein
VKIPRNGGSDKFYSVGDIVDIKVNGAVQKGSVQSEVPFDFNFFAQSLAMSNMNFAKDMRHAHPYAL